MGFISNMMTAKIIERYMLDPSVIYVPEGGFGGNSNVNRKKFTILGETGSGKTCYLLGMYDELTMGIGKYTILATNDDDKKNLTRSFNRMLDETRGQERFPENTSEKSEINFELKYAFETVCSFDWVDYPGDFLNPATNDTSSEDYKKVAKNIQSSSTLFICIDGKNLIEGTTAEKIRRVKRKCCRNINPYLGELMENLKTKNENLPPIVMIITKYDLCMNYTDENEMKAIIFGAFESLFGNKKNFIAVIPCSLGEKISDDNYTGEIKPLNIELPILLGVNFALIDSFAEYYSIKKNIEDSKDDMERRKRSEENSFFLWRNDSYIANLRDDIDNANKRMQELKKTVDATTGRFNEINKELECINLYFANGQWQEPGTIQETFKNLQEMRFNKFRGW